jgi:6-phosphofructokinase 1
MEKEKTIGILTSGGDAPGMNAAIRAVVRTALNLNMQVLGIRRGYNGLLTKDIMEMNLRTVSGIIHRGGTILYTARCAEFKTEEGLKKAVCNCHELGIDGLVVIGGDGSFRGARDLSERGIPTVGIPGTIDNDIACSDYTIGFDTACNIGMEAVDRLRDTAQSHERCSIVEVMGRSAGHLALHVGVATGAIAVVIPERKFSMEAIAKKIRQGQKTGKTHHIIIVAEGVEGGGAKIMEGVTKLTGMETRLTVLGHIQRGGNPTVVDRVNATKMGFKAAELLNLGIGNQIIAQKNDQIIGVDIFEGLKTQKTIDENLYQIEKIVSK